MFFVPNELEQIFRGRLGVGTPRDPGVRLIEAIDLIVTKQLTDGHRTRRIFAFSLNKIEAQYR